MSQDNPYAAPHADANLAGYGPAGGQGLPDATYEFGIYENAVLEKLAAAMRFVGIFLAVMGGLGAFGGFMQLFQIGPRALSTMGASAALLLQGIWTNSAAAAFRQIVHTEGNDIANLMDACRALRRSFVVIAIGAVISLAGVAVTFALGPPPSVTAAHTADPTLTTPSQ